MKNADGPKLTLYTTRELAEMAGWDTQRMRRHLKSQKAFTKLKNGRIVTTPALLASDAEEIWHQLAAWGERAV